MTGSRGYIVNAWAHWDGKGEQDVMLYGLCEWCASPRYPVRRVQTADGHTTEETRFACRCFPQAEDEHRG